ncbi:RluA family pseudouridine synthase [Desulfuromonas carbonis]|uniref:RluA family pseudouridine synthase n=1 Tax=Desulfuromonas sp. DDH964 TaxID=1823759 RepID=UPI00078DDB5F|nr:RluA family pseudouridine synthase [Desulfuromonas sp. DDH964]AMV73017.1 RNA pseudouridine synthase, RluA family [Desulfuromonas sp. DDH964]
MIDLTVHEDENGISVGAWLQQRLPGIPSGYLRQLLRRGEIRVAGRALAADASLRPGDAIALPENRRLQELLAGILPPLTILVETREALIVAKPAGVAVHRGVGHETDHLGLRVEQLLRQRRQTFRTAPVHRLDAATSGPVLFGKGRQAIAAFGGVFMNGPTSKRYLALVAGRTPTEGTLDSPVPVRGRDYAATTRFRCLAGNGNLSLLELQLLTGRRHQLRRQLADAGHPIAGDERYRGGALPGLGRLFLHCRQLVVANPFGEEPLVAELALPGDLAQLLDRLGLQLPPPLGAGGPTILL